MSERVYRTANGKALDMGALVSKNEDTRAVGNMGVNAKGEKVKRTYDTHKQSTKTGRLEVRPERQTNKMRSAHGRFSPTMKALNDQVVEAIKNAPPVVIESVIQENIAIDTESVIIEEQIQTIADQMLETIVDVSVEELKALEELDMMDESDPESAPVELTGLAAAMAKAQKLKESK